MSVMRNFFLACSQSRWLREQAPKYWFVRRTVSRFMPGEDLEDALSAAAMLRGKGIGTVFTQLGENVTSASEADAVTNQYQEVLGRIPERGLNTEISVKLTQLGLDLSPELCLANFLKVVRKEDLSRVVWIDMEASPYVDRTIEIFRQARATFKNVGICLQAYLYRTEKDIENLLPLGPAIRLVKGAYMEPPDLAFPRKKDVDENYFKLASRLISREARAAGVRAAFATHDRALIRRITQFAESQQVGKDQYEFQMLFGIQRAEQLRLAREGWRSMVLIAYGSYWFPWFMRRLAERPANALFVVRNLLPS